jgi:hypothetical protein
MCSAERIFRRPRLAQREQTLGCITGVEWRQNWPTENKLKIVAESLIDGVVMSDVTRQLVRETLLGNIGVSVSRYRPPGALGRKLFAAKPLCCMYSDDDGSGIKRESITWQLRSR